MKICASLVLPKTSQKPNILSKVMLCNLKTQTLLCVELSVADLVAAGQTPGRRRCSHCSSSVYGAHTLSLSGSLAPRRLFRATSGAAVDTGHSSGAVWTGGGWGTRSPERQKMK